MDRPALRGRGVGASRPIACRVGGSLVGPFRQQVADDGISDEELERLFTDAREESFRGRHCRSSDERWSGLGPGQTGTRH